MASVDDNNTTVATNVTVTTAGKDMNSSTPRILNDTDSLSTEKQNPIELRDTNGLLQRSLYVVSDVESLNDHFNKKQSFLCRVPGTTEQRILTKLY